MRRLFNDLKILLLANLWLLPVFGLLVGALFYFVAPPPPMHARLLSGSPGSSYHAFAEQLQARLAEEGFALELVSSAGSGHNLSRLLDGEAELALVQGGQELQLSAEQRKQLSGLGLMFREPLWLFSSGYVPFERLTDLRDLRVGLGRPGSSAAALSAALLSANRIEAADYPANWQAIGGKRAAQALLEGQLDVAIFVGQADSPLIQQLAGEPSLRLLSLSRSPAYLARLPYLSRVDVGQGVLDLASNSPGRDIITLAPAATLVAGQNFHPSLTPLILEAARQVLQDGNLLDPPGSYPQPASHALPSLRETRYYHDKGLPILQRYLPFRIASLADRYIILAIPLLVLLFPLFKAIGPIYQWRIRARIYRWYKHLREIDQQLHDGTLPALLDSEIQRLEQLQDELAQVQVPLSYSSELYQLHLHLRYVIERLRALQKRRGAEGE